MTSLNIDVISTGGWMFIQNRADGKVSFARSWSEYEYGFGTLNGDHWIGLAHQKMMMDFLRKRGFEFDLKINLGAYTEKPLRGYPTKEYSLNLNGRNKVAVYHGYFLREPYYRLSLRSYDEARSSAADGLMQVWGSSQDTHVGKPFSAPNHFPIMSEFDASCANQYQGGWWYQYENCRGNANLNLPYRARAHALVHNWFVTG